MTPPKRRVSAAELCWVITNRIREMRGIPPTLALAVIPDKDLGWRVVVGGRNRSAITPEVSQQLQQVEQKLREGYILVED